MLQEIGTERPSPFIISKYLSKHTDFQGNFVKCVIFKASRPNKTHHLGAIVVMATKNIINGTRTKGSLILSVRSAPKKTQVGNP